jgi:hypothetical protein
VEATGDNVPDHIVSVRNQSLVLVSYYNFKM